MKVSRSAFPIQGETTVKKALLVVAAALLFLNTLVVPTVARADGGTSTGGNCSGQTACKP
jgi:hypothetical protein